MSPNRPCFNTRGFTLIEIVVTIVVLAIAATALLGVFGTTVGSSANPMVQQQAISIAEAYMEEILLKDFSDPDGVDGETVRANFDDVQDYDGIASAAVSDQSGGTNAVFDDYINALGAYDISVNIVGVDFNGIAAADSLRIDITVNHPAIDPIAISGYRTNYP